MQYIAATVDSAICKPTHWARHCK